MKVTLFFISTFFFTFLYDIQISIAESSRSEKGTPDPTIPWNAPIAEAASRFNLPEPWIREVMRRESNGRPSATSWTGAAGLMQLMPGTYRGLRRRYGLGPDPYDPRDNVMAGAAYLREMYDQYGAPGFLAAYNAGPARAESYLAGGSLPRETIAYLSHFARRLGSWAGLLPAPADGPAAPREADGERVSSSVRYGSAAGGPLRMASLEAAGAAPIDVSPGLRTGGWPHPFRPLAAPLLSEAPPPPRLVLAMATARRFHPPAHPMPSPSPRAAPPSDTFDAVYRMPDPAPDPAAMPSGAVVGAYGDWGVEIGAYSGPEAARAAATGVAAALLRRGAGGQPVVTRIEDDGRVAYRAELVGLDGAQAVAACNELIRQDQHCVAIQPKS